MTNEVVGCIFCQISSRKIPARIVDESDDFIAFHDVNPGAPVHLLVIPKVHIGSVNELNEKLAILMSGLFLFAKKQATHLKLQDSGYRLVINTGADAGQSVFHLHMHLLGGRHLTWPPG